MFIIKKYMKRQKGFMLTEVLITAVLIVITMVGIIPVLFSGMKAVKISKTKAIGMNIVQKEIESFNQDKFTNVYKYIQSQTSSVDFNNKFLKGTGIINGNLDDNNSGTYKEVVLPTIYVNTVNGSISNTSKPGYKGSTLTKKYSFIGGETEVVNSVTVDKTITDDAIQLSVTLAINGETPIKMTSILSRDRLN